MQGKTILVFGASSGIGYELAKRLSAAGATVLSASRHAPEGLDVQHLDWDAAQPNPDFGKQLPEVLHGLVYAPGTINLKPFNRVTNAELQAELQVNAFGAVAALQAAHLALKKAEGASVVLFSTVAVQTGMPYHAIVAMAKGAVEGLTRSLAAEWATNRIRVNAIAPSLTDTPLAQPLLSTPEKQDASNKRHPLGRYGTPADIATAAQFLLSDESTWMTGQVLGVDGGMGRLK
jgi:NAD(P)-dependent dehydrogenase (short-subunit alcohol dehydrogenase family)